MGLSNLFPFYIYDLYFYIYLLGFVTSLISNLFFLFFHRGVPLKKSITFD